VDDTVPGTSDHRVASRAKMFGNRFAGGSPDIIARLIGQWLSERLAQPFFVDDRPGASGNIGTEIVVVPTPFQLAGDQPVLRRGGGVSLSPGSILPLRGTGDAASGCWPKKRHHRRCREPGNFAARVLVGRRPGSWIAEWMDRRVVRDSLLLVTLPPPNFAPPLIAFQQHP